MIEDEIDKSKLSIITVCFNEAGDIAKTCDSVVGQNYDNFEWIVVDGGSTDGTVEILKKYEKNITILISEKDNGVYDAMNKGIKMAKGDYVIFLNGGDSLFGKDVLDKVFGKSLYGADVLYGNCCVVNMDSSQQILDFPESIDRKYFIDSNINHQSTFIKKDLFERCGYYNNDYRILADYEKWLCFFDKKAIFKKIPLVVSNFKGFNGLSSREQLKDLVEKERNVIMKKYFKLHDILSCKLKKFLHEKFKQGAFIVFSPKKFIKKYVEAILNSGMRKPVRKVYYMIRFRKIP